MSNHRAPPAAPDRGEPPWSCSPCWPCPGRGLRRGLERQLGRRARAPTTRRPTCPECPLAALDAATGPVDGHPVALPVGQDRRHPQGPGRPVQRLADQGQGRASRARAPRTTSCSASTRPASRTTTCPAIAVHGRHRHPAGHRLQDGAAGPVVHRRRPHRPERLPPVGPRLLHGQRRAVAGLGEPVGRAALLQPGPVPARPVSTRTRRPRRWTRSASTPRRSRTPAWSTKPVALKVNSPMIEMWLTGAGSPGGEQRQRPGHRHHRPGRVRQRHHPPALHMDRRHEATTACSP